MSEAMWAHRISRHGATKVTPFELVYGQEAVLPVELNLDGYRLAKQNDLSTVMYHDMIMDNVDEVTNKRLKGRWRKTKLELPKHITRKSRVNRSKWKI